MDKGKDHAEQLDIQSVVPWMIEQGYMVNHKGKYKVTEKFYAEVTGIAQGITVYKGSLPVSSPHSPEQDWRLAYIQFIMDADVPRYCLSTGGGSYELNKYSEEGMKAFRKMIEKEGIVYALLVKSTLLYYKSKTALKVSIGNYIAKGLWRSDYDALIKSAEGGEQALIDHIKQTTDDSSSSRYEIG